MRDQYASDVSDALKFAFLRALAGADRTLGIASYYAPVDDGRADGTSHDMTSRRGGDLTQNFTSAFRGLLVAGATAVRAVTINGSLL